MMIFDLPQGVADEYNRLKALKRVSTHESAQEFILNQSVPTKA